MKNSGAGNDSPKGPAAHVSAAPAGERTLICSVVFADLVEHTRKPVEAQAASKRRFNAHLAESLAGIAAAERILLDTGDGAAIGFLADPEDALYAAIAIRGGMDASGADDAAADHIRDALRIGINIGPVKRLYDVNGHANLVGDGINFAQRVMAFAQPGEILVSRSFRDVITCLSTEYAEMFRYLGAHAEKHVREHDVFVLGECLQPFNQLAARIAARAAYDAVLAVRPVRAVIAEDEPILREELRELLAAIWPDLEIVGVAGDGLAALRAIETFNPDVAFLDIQVPRMSGIEVARAIGNRVHVVMATAYDEHAIKAFDAGAIDYILKPYQPARLVATCQRIKQQLGILPRRGAGRPEKT